MYPASHNAGRKKLCRPELALNAMPMSTLIWTRTRAKLCLVKNVERTWKLLDSIPSSWTLSKRRSRKTRTKTNSRNGGQVQLTGAGQESKRAYNNLLLLLSVPASVTYSPLDTQSGFVAKLTHVGPQP